MKARCALAVLGAAFVLCGAAAAGGSATQTAPDSTEAGLLMDAWKAEQSFQTSPLLVRDEALNAYVKGVVCKLAPADCAAIRIYILDIPVFNAAMLPNGALQIWTGALLRVRNEAQLAAILGHEITHYLLNHSRARLRRQRNAEIATIAGLAVPSAGVVALISTIVGRNMMYSYTRDDEREADAKGFDMIVAAGYDPAEIAALWREILQEESLTKKTDSDSDNDIIFVYSKTHPDTGERVVEMDKRVKALGAGGSALTVGAEAYRQATALWRAKWLDEEIALEQYDRSLVLVNALLTDDPNSGELKFYLGEIYRRRNSEGDPNRALEAYRAAAAANGTPVALWRSLGIVAMKTGDKAEAREAFTKYLAAVPGADDRAMIEYYLSKL